MVSYDKYRTTVICDTSSSMHFNKPGTEQPHVAPLLGSFRHIILLLVSPTQTVLCKYIMFIQWVPVLTFHDRVSFQDLLFNPGMLSTDCCQEL